MELGVRASRMIHQSGSGAKGAGGMGVCGAAQPLVFPPRCAFEVRTFYGVKF